MENGGPSRRQREYIRGGPVRMQPWRVAPVEQLLGPERTHSAADRPGRPESQQRDRPDVANLPTEFGNSRRTRIRHGAVRGIPDDVDRGSEPSAVPAVRQPG